jgi:hypothetical protein
VRSVGAGLARGAGSLMRGVQNRVTDVRRGDDELDLEDEDSEAAVAATSRDAEDGS